MTAKIVGLTTFGAFASVIPGIDGLIHISEISHSHIGNPAEVLKIGDEVQVKILDIDFDKKRVSLSMKALLDPPAVETKEGEPGSIDELAAQAKAEEAAEGAAPAEEAPPAEEAAPAEETAE